MGKLRGGGETGQLHHVRDYGIVRQLQAGWLTEGQSRVAWRLFRRAQDGSSKKVVD